MGRLRVTVNKKTKGKKALTPQEAFAKLWKQVQKEQLLVSQIPEQIQQFYQTYLTTIGPYESQWCRLLADEIQLMLSHWQKKSLREQDRYFLVEYVADNFRELMSNPFRDFELTGLEELFTELMAQAEEPKRAAKPPGTEDMFATDEEADEEIEAEDPFSAYDEDFAEDELLEEEYQR
ncbi:MAG TPA: hypothetical protein PK011_15180, partial [Marinagarivorans sp.]|nr:hypothetical protein [Marinagarivorans sp.]